MAVRLDTVSFWRDSTSMPRFAKLDRDAQVDVVVIGGGITGLTAAYLLSDAGKSVAVLERRRCAEIDTGHTTAHLTMVTDLRISELVKQFGRDHAQAVWDAQLAGIAQIEAVARAEDIDCDFEWVAGYLHAPSAVHRDHGAEPTDAVARLREDARTAAELGFDAAFVEHVPIVDAPGIQFDNQARFHPRKYLAGVARVLADRGVRVYEHSNADGFSDNPRHVTSNGHQIACDHVVIATHTPLMGLTNLASATLFQTKLALYSSYVVAGRIDKGRLPDALFWDTADPYDYIRLEPQRDHDLVIYGGEDHKTGQADDTEQCYRRLEERLTALLPGVDVTHRWSAQVVETHDGLPYIGETAERQFAATGYAGNGMTFGTVAGMMAADYVLGQKNPWSGLFDPGRKNIRAGAWDYVKENKDYPYYLVRDRFAGAEGRLLREVKRGEGKVLDYKGQNVAAYRDEAGRLSLRSAVCTHMGCLVDWNRAERTWDCPCHGSRFTTEGKVIGGPAESPLAPID